MNRNARVESIGQKFPGCRGFVREVLRGGQYRVELDGLPEPSQHVVFPENELREIADFFRLSIHHGGGMGSTVRTKDHYGTEPGKPLCKCKGSFSGSSGLSRRQIPATPGRSDCSTCIRLANELIPTLPPEEVIPVTIKIGDYLTATLVDGQNGEPRQGWYTKDNGDGTIVLEGEAGTYICQKEGAVKVTNPPRRQARVKPFDVALEAYFEMLDSGKSSADSAFFESGLCESLETLRPGKPKCKWLDTPEGFVIEGHRITLKLENTDSGIQVRLIIGEELTPFFAVELGKELRKLALRLSQESFPRVEYSTTSVEGFVIFSVKGCDLKLRVDEKRRRISIEGTDTLPMNLAYVVGERLTTYGYGIARFFGKDADMDEEEQDATS